VFAVENQGRAYDTSLQLSRLIDTLQKKFASIARPTFRLFDRRTSRLRETGGLTLTGNSAKVQTMFVKQLKRGAEMRGGGNKQLPSTGPSLSITDARRVQVDVDREPL